MVLKKIKLANSCFMALNWRSWIVTSGQILRGVQHHGYSSRNSCRYHWFTSVFSPSLRRRMWRDEIKTYQVDKSIRLVAWLWHEALKARNLSLHTRESTLLFFPWPFWDSKSVLDWGWWELKIGREKEKRLETCCCRKQMITEHKLSLHPGLYLWQWSG